MSDIKLTFAILHTNEMTAAKIKSESPEITDADVQNLVKVFSMMDGQKALLLPSLDSGNEYSFIGLGDESADKELSYQMEQDSYIGCYINQREEFDVVYDSGEYSRDVLFYIEKKYAEIISEQEWLAQG